MLHLQAGTLPLSIPSSWDELTLGQFLTYLQAETDADVLCALSGVPLTELKPNQEPDLRPVMNLLTWLEEFPDFQTLLVPTHLTIKDQALPIPARIDKQVRLSQLWDLNSAYRALRADRHAINAIPLARCILSVFLYQALTGKPYPYLQQAWQDNALLAQIDALPVTEALPLAHHLFDSFVNPKLPAPNAERNRIRTTQIPTQSSSWWQRIHYWLWRRGIYLPEAQSVPAKPDGFLLIYLPD